MAKPKKIKGNKIPRNLTHDGDIERSPEEVTDCLFEVVAGTKTPEAFGLADRQQAIDLLPSCEGGVQALARAESAWEASEEESKRLAIAEKNAKLTESATDTDEENTDLEQEDENADIEGTGEETPPSGKTVVIGARGAPVKHPYQAKMRALGVVKGHELKIKNLINHATDYNEVVSGWNVESDGQTVRQPADGEAMTLAEIGQAAVRALKEWFNAINSLPEGYKPKSGRTSTAAGSNTADELPKGSKVVLREKFRKTYASFMTDTAQTMTVELSAGSKVKCSTSAGFVLIARRELKLASDSAS